MLAIAFEGCACRAAFHAGVAAAVAERGLPIALTAGASSGSLIAVGLAAGRGAELPAIWRALAGRSIVSLERLFHNRSPFDMSHLVRTTLEATLGGRTADLRARPVEALVTATRLRDLRRVVFHRPRHRRRLRRRPPLLRLRDCETTSINIVASRSSPGADPPRRAALSYFQLTRKRAPLAVAAPASVSTPTCFIPVASRIPSSTPR